MRTSYVSKHADEREKKKKREELKKQQLLKTRNQLSEVYVDLKGKSDSNPSNKLSEKKKSKKWLIPVILLLVISIVCGVYFVSLSNSQKNTENPQIEDSISLEDSQELGICVLGEGCYMV